MLAILAFFAYFLALLPTGFVAVATAQEPVAQTVSASATHIDTAHGIMEAIAKCCMKEKAGAGVPTCKIDCTATVPEFLANHAEARSAFGMPPCGPAPQTSSMPFFRPPIAI